MVLIGPITKDASIKKLKDGRQVVNFSIAINDFYKPKDREQGVTITTYYDCSYWIFPKIAPRLTKGSLVELQGRITVNPYTSLNGEPKASLKCHVNSISIHQYIKAEAAPLLKEEVAEDLPF